ncbi:MAG: MFS transporter, partial [Acidobacteriaceae bacterium]|nr:MFS transporter [Acidobacteriaceae bacterium]
MRRVKLAWWATVLLFLAHGLVVSTWVSRIPAVQSSLHINNGVLGLTLLSSAIGAVTTIPVTGWFITRYGSRKVAVTTSIAFCCGLSLLGVAFNAVTLSIALFFFGAVAAGMDVSMNAHGVEVEKELGAPTMSRFHGMFSLGGMIGAGIGGWVAAHGITHLPHFAASAAVNLALVLLAWPAMLDTHDAAVPSGHRLPLNRIPRVLLALSAIAFCILLSEGAMADWTAVYMRQVQHAGPGIAA